MPTSSDALDAAKASGDREVVQQFSLTQLFVRLDAHGSDLDVRRDRDGRLSMLGQSFDLDSRQARSDDESGKFVDWLVGQRRIALSDATIRWTDETGNSQALVLRGVTLNILKQGMEQIGRASCRERVGQYVRISVVAVSYKKKKN